MERLGRVTMIVHEEFDTIMCVKLVTIQGVYELYEHVQISYGFVSFVEIRVCQALASSQSVYLVLIRLSSYAHYNYSTLKKYMLTPKNWKKDSPKFFLQCKQR